MAESHRLAGQKRWEGLNRAERAEATQKSRDSRKLNADLLRGMAADLAALRADFERLIADRDNVAA